MINLSSKTEISSYFYDIGYANNSVENFDKEIMDLNYEWIEKIHLISNTLDFKIWLIEVNQSKVDLMNLIAHRMYRKNPFEYNLLIFTDLDFNNITFLHYHKDTSSKIKIKRLNVDSHSITATDIEILKEIKISGKDIIDDLDIFRIHKEAFDIEKVTERFFEQFKYQIDNIKTKIIGLTNENSKKDYAVLLTSRLIFLYFIQKKGWLNGVKNYLYDRYLYCINNDLNYYDEILKPLFFECLNAPPEGDLLCQTQRSEQAKKLYEGYISVIDDNVINEDFKGIPYLNGGLFEQHDQYEVSNTITIENDVFRNLFENLLNKYNFTVREDLGYDTDIAVDPEFLGRIFENMIHEVDRSSTGSFYTPRYIIHKMCKDSIRNYLLLNVQNIAVEKIEHLLENLEDENIYSREKKIIKNLLSREFEIEDFSKYKLSKNETIELLVLLEKIKICDPAVGSGAFVLGMLHMLVELKKKLNAHAFGNNKLNIYNTKLNIIQENLYGVDIQQGAVDISRLRLWLSLAVEHEAKSVSEVKPLPNLSFKIMLGNSLVSSFYGTDLDDEVEKLGFGQINLFQEKSEMQLLIDNTIILKNQYFNATYDKKKIENDINDFEKAFYKIILKDESFTNNDLNAFIKENRNLFFFWKINFSDVFEKGGFDVIIGNPPYGAKFSSEEKGYLELKYPDVADYESSQFFYLRGLELLKENGFIGYITTNTFLFNVNARKFRAKIISDYTLSNIYDLTEVNVFKKASVRTVIANGKKSISRNSNLEYYFFEEDDFVFINAKSSKDLYKDDKNWIYMMRFNKEQEELIEKIRKKGALLSQDFDVSQGLIPYDKYQGHSPETINNRIWHSDQQEDGTYKPELKGENVKSYRVEWDGKVWISYGDWLAAPREPRFFTKPRVLVREIVDKASGRLYAGYTEEEYYNTPSIINIVARTGDVSLIYLLGLLNSKLFAIYNFGTSPKAKKGLFPKVLVADIRKLPIKRGNNEQIKMVEDKTLIISSLLTQGSDIKNIIEIQEELDRIIYDIYGISELQENILNSIITK